MNDKAITDVAFKISSLSAGYDPSYKTWYGFDTDVGNLPKAVAELISPIVEKLEAKNADLRKSLENWIKTAEKYSKEYIELKARWENLKDKPWLWCKKKKYNEGCYFCPHIQRCLDKKGQLESDNHHFANGCHFCEACNDFYDTKKQHMNELLKGGKCGGT